MPRARMLSKDPPFLHRIESVDFELWLGDWYSRDQIYNATWTDDALTSSIYK